MLAIACAVIAAGLAAQEAPAGSEWLTFAWDPQRSGWNRQEHGLTPANAGGMRRLWKTALPNRPHVLAGLSAPLVANHGGRDLVIVAGSDDHLFALDASSGELAWQADFTTDAKPAAAEDWLCPNALNATPVVDKANARVFVISADGRLHTLGLADGKPLAPPVHFVPPFSKMWSLSYVDGVLYSATSQDCNGARSGVWALDPSSPGRAVTVVYTAASCTKGFCGGGIWGRGGVAADSRGKLYVATGDAAFDPAAGQWGTAVLRLAQRSLAIEDWFVPKNRDFVDKLDLDLGNTTPIVFSWRDRQLTAVGGKEGVLYLMDTAALGGSDHQTITWTSPLLSNDMHSFQKHGVWGSISSWTGGDGRVWLYVPTYGPTAAAQAAAFSNRYGEDPNGSIQAFTVEADASGRPYLKPQWRSIDLKMPDPVAIADGVVFALATGEDATQATVDQIQDARMGPGGNVFDEKQRVRRHEGAHATLYALDAQSGRQLWSSGTAIGDWTHFSMPAVAAGRVFVTTNAGQVYAFGLGEDHGEHVYAPPANAEAKVAPQQGAADKAPSPAGLQPQPSGARPAVPADPATQALFARRCAACHGASGEGRSSTHTPDMRASIWQKARTDAQLAEAIRGGRPGMPPFAASLKDDEVRALVRFLRALR